MNLSIKIYPKTTALRIAKQLKSNKGVTNESTLLFFLPDEVWGKTHKVVGISELSRAFVVNVSISSLGMTQWSIPVCFVEKIIQNKN